MAHLGQKFKRTIHLTTDPVIPYGTDETNETTLTFLTNCHWGALKLFYSEIEYLTIVSNYIDISKSNCLIVYIGAQPGWRIKYLYVDKYFPNTNWLLYDPLRFDIESSNEIIIKTGDDGWFSDDKIAEVLSIAKSRKIVLISDIRMTNDDNEYENEKLIYGDMLKQQRWGIAMNAEFMLLKFRLFFYKYNPKEIDFIDNNAIYNEFKSIMKVKLDEKKQKTKYSDLLYLAGRIYTQIYAPIRSTESRLFVKKNKYYVNCKSNCDTYKFKYYGTIQYEGAFNYHNTIRRNQQFDYKLSSKLSKYIPGSFPNFENASEYYIIRKYLKLHNDKKMRFSDILNEIIFVRLSLGERYHANQVSCKYWKAIQKLIVKSSHASFFDNYFIPYLRQQIAKINKQFDQLKKTSLVDSDTIQKYITVHNCSNMLFKINNGEIILIANS